VSTEKLDKLREDREKQDKSINFQRDVESDWTIKNNVPNKPKVQVAMA